VLSRETATLSVPAGDAAFPEALISRLGRAIADAKAADNAAEIGTTEPVLMLSADDGIFNKLLG
jgi:hypothetical protein